MSLTTSVPIFPGFGPGRTFTSQGYPVRGPGWSVKQTPKFNNFRQQTVNGGMLVVKYWPSPLWDWEWTYEVILDNPNVQNAYYNVPVPYTDFQILQGFWNGMQGGGNEFLYQPPDSQIGGATAVITSVQVLSNLVYLSIANSTYAPGLYGIPTGLTGASFLNGLTIQILQVTPTTVVLGGGTFTHADYGPTADSGNLAAGQLLGSTVVSPVDGKYYTEAVHMTGGYPTIPITGTPSVTTQVTESVQVIQTTGRKIYANGADVSGSATVVAADTVSPYLGITFQFVASQTGPIVWSGKYYYLCRFPEDMQEWENFSTMLWAAKSFKFGQVRI